MFSNKIYDILSKIQRWIPALGVFYLTLCKIWNLPFGDEINQTIVAIAVLLAATLEVSSARYFKTESQHSILDNHAHLRGGEAEGNE